MFYYTVLIAVGIKQKYILPICSATICNLFMDLLIKIILISFAAKASANALPIPSVAPVITKNHTKFINSFKRINPVKSVIRNFAKLI